MTTERWTDEMIDDLASSVAELGENVDGVRLTAQALLQVAAQQQQATQRHEAEMEQLKQRQAESDERFNSLLAEVRYLIRGMERNEAQEEENDDQAS